MRAATAALALLLLAGLAFAENWPAWRGPRGDGTSAEKGLPTKWSPTENVRWKVKLPGPGNSTPVVWGERVFLTQSLDRAGTRRAVLCLHRKDGHELWRKEIAFKGKEPTHDTNPYCSASPVTDGEVVVASHGSAGVVCYDLDGKQLWHRDLGPFVHIWGTGSSPVLHGGLVILPCGPGKRTFLLAVDRKTGNDVWKKDEPGGQSGLKGTKWTGSWSTPTLLRVGGKDQLLMSWPGALKAYDPKTGDLLWTCKGLTDLVYTSPLATPEVVVAMSGFYGAALAVRTGGKGDVTASHRLWRHPPGNPQRIGSGVIVGEHLYHVNAGPGTAQCIELKTGKDLWDKKRLGGDHWGSLVHADGKLYATDQSGTTFVLAASPKFEVLERNRLGERTNASLAVSDGDVFIRTYRHLWCIGRPSK
jgi:outer membrane protein assembly factor BamB